MRANCIIAGNIMEMKYSLTCAQRIVFLCICGNSYVYEIDCWILLEMKLI
jgi:hypothetical protein